MNPYLAKFSPLQKIFRVFDTLTREEAIQLVVPLLESMRKYHQHEVLGIESLPKKGGALIAVNHSLATYDIVLLMFSMYTDLDRIPRPLLDRLFFKIPILRDLVTKLGGVQGSPSVAQQLLKSNELITVAPGGMFEALRPSHEKYQIRWHQRYGFARLAMITKKPIILAACPKADDMYKVYPSHLTSWIYQTYKVPFFLARGIGPTPIPRPVKLVHHLSEPIVPPHLPKSTKAQESSIRKFHSHLVERMESLIATAIATDNSSGI